MTRKKHGEFLIEFEATDFAYKLAKDVFISFCKALPIIRGISRVTLNGKEPKR